mmetsp:Transcript_3461/g.8227  ORF Transcript_3461/g.8227 Transcript_3461/m.8227 type:complete len:503 (-) Transcript_3461:256-1764(-)
MDFVENLLDGTSVDQYQDQAHHDHDHDHHDHQQRWLEAASELYDQVTFKTDAMFNQPAPEYWVSFIIGGVFSLFGVMMWARRVYQTKQDVEKLGVPFEGSTLLRAMISRAIDNDDPLYTVISFGAFSFLFLGGIQLSYQNTLVAMLIVYAVASFGDSARILLAVKSANSLKDVVQTSSIVHSSLRKKQEQLQSTRLNPSNVYEDLGRGKTIVIMVFITQCILISFVFVDLFDSQTTSCRDGSSGCPVAGTAGSYGFYVLGIFMACVYMLGPKTAFGQSEQNPAYWIEMLIAAKRTGAKVTWYDPVENKTMHRVLSPSDIRVWFRFFMSFLINGVGYHILVHALPIQVATQSSLTGVVFRAVGMMYLVDLDDTAGYTLTLVEEPEGGSSSSPAKDDVKPSPTEEETIKESDSKDEQPSAAEVSDEAQRIIAEAKAQLDALSRGDYSMNKKAKMKGNNKLAAAGLVMNSDMANKDNADGDDNDGGDGGDDGGAAAAEEGAVVEA